MKLLTRSISLLLIALLTGCGGSGGETNPWASPETREKERQEKEEEKEEEKAPPLGGIKQAPEVCAELEEVT